ncbi:MAG TPA: adenylate/guanylate cyclase domain-containing protein [Treponemataceae bacterium]|nr:adenylate/guanylate cyclase domain-containing protein [Treponemataceae bacterium]
MKKVSLFQKAGKTRIIPISVKILVVFILLLLLSNFVTNYINLQMNQRQIITLTNKILVNQLKDIYTTATNQFEIFKFSQDTGSAVEAINNAAKKGFAYPNSVAMGVMEDGSFVFNSSASDNFGYFPDNSALRSLIDARASGILEGSLRFSSYKGEYFGVYKFHEEWKCYCIRAELLSDTEEESAKIFILISMVILFLTVIFLFAGLVMFSKIMDNVGRITHSLYKMQSSQSLGLLDLEGAPNDDITYLGVSFNALSVTINNLLGIFQKFVSKDVVDSAYREHSIRLEGTQRELTVLFSDIRGFTYMTETLGNDIINLLNIHYDRAIHAIHIQNGIIGSIIGDAVLAVYGAINSRENKSIEALESAWAITKVTAELREKLIERRKEIEKDHVLTEAEERVYKAVLLDVGVGIDGGKVFYGNIGSFERMTNTVIGDNVNSSSRLEGLTRVYHLPVIVSEYVKDDVLSKTKKYRFFEIDMVQVKGKTEGKRIYLPLNVEETDERTISNYEIFESALQAYYRGDWTQARQLFKSCGVETAKVFLDRITIKQAPENWSGIWTMTTK